MSHLKPKTLANTNGFFLRFYLFFRERAREGEREERNIDVQEKHQLVTSQMPPTGDLAHNCIPYVYLDLNRTDELQFLLWALFNPLNHTSQSYTSTLHIG